MSSAHELDLGPLTWVKGEIDLALERSETALAEAGSAPDRLGRIKFAQTHLHQAHGALSIVGLDGLTQFSEHVDRLLGELAAGQVSYTPEVARLASRCIAAIGNYLDELTRGQPDQALRLFDLYVELAAARGQEPPTPGELFYPDLSQRPVFAGPADTSEDPKRLRALRGRFERGLLKWFRNGLDPAGPQEMREAVSGIERLQGVPTSRAFWFAATAFFDALEQRDAPADPATKRLCGRIDAQMRRVMEGSSMVAERLMRDVLYHVASTSAQSPSIAAVREAYALERLIPAGKYQISDTPQAPLLRKLREGFADARDAWSQFSKGGAIGLPRFQESIAPLATQARELNHPEIAEFVESLTDLALWLRQDPLQFNDTMSMDVATLMLLVDAQLDTHSQGAPDNTPQIQALINRLQAHKRGEHLPPLDIIKPESDDRQINRQLAHEILASLGDVEQSLDSFFRAPTQTDILNAVRAPLKQIEGALSVMNEDGAVRLLQDAAARIAALTTAGSDADTPAFEEIAHRLSALGVYIEALQHGPADLDRILRPDQPAPATSGASIEAELDQQKRDAAALAAALKDNPDDFGLRTELQLNLENLRQDASLTANTELEKQARQALTMLDAGELFAEAVPLASSPEAPALSAEATRLLDASAAEIDAELLDIFIEEAIDVRATIARNLVLLDEAPDDTDVLTTIRRSFHTLKGSGRMVGLKDFGEAAWSIEQTLNHWLRVEQAVTPELLSLIGQALAEFSGWIEQLQSGSGPQRDVSALLAESARLRGDGDAEFPAATPTPAEPDTAPVAPPAPEIPAQLDTALTIEAPEFDDYQPTESSLISVSLTDEPQELDLEATLLLNEYDLAATALNLPRAMVEEAPDEAFDLNFPELSFVDPAGSDAPTATKEATGGAAGSRVDELLLQDDLASPHFDLSFELPSEAVEEPVASDEDVFLPIEALEIVGEEAPVTEDSQADTPDEVLEVEDLFEDDGALAGTRMPEPAGAAEIIDAPEVFEVPEVFDAPETIEAFEALESIDFAEPIERAELTDVPALQDEPLEPDAFPEIDEPGTDAEPEAGEGQTDNEAPVEAPDVLDLADLPDDEDTKPEASTDPDEVRLGDVTLSRPLFDLYLAEARQHVATLRHELARLSVNPSLIPTGGAIRAAHTLAGISGTARFSAPQQLAKALELAQQRLTDHDRAPTAPQAATLNAAATALESMLVQLASRQLPEPMPELAGALDDILVSHLAEVIALHPASAPEALVTPASSRDAAPRPPETPAAPSAPLRDELDPELLPIFLDEGSELLDNLDAALRNWRDDPADPGHASSVARLLHTLKGSARMVGAMSLGQSLHELETRLERARSQAPGGQGIVDDLEASLDQARQALENLQQPAPVATVINEAPVASEDSAPAQPGDTTAPGTRVQLRVEASRIDQFVNEAGEISIARTRIEGELRTLRRSLLDLTENVIRLRNQLREVEIQADTQMQSRLSQVETQHTEFDPLEMDRYTRLQELTRMMAESVGDVTTVQQNLLRNLDGAEVALHSQSRMARELQQSLMHVRMVPFDSLAERLYRLVRQTAKELGRRANLDIIGGQIEIDRSVLDAMTGPLGHLVRNAVAHGIESPEKRREAGKPEIGQINLRVSHEGNEVVMEFRDDGAGLDFQRIRAQAIESGLLAPDEDADDKRLTNLIFVPGFTTASLSSLAGRGVGMDVVKSETAAVGGRISVDSTPGQGTCFRIHLPLTLAVTQALLVRAGNRTFAIPSSMVAQVLELKASALEKLRDERGTDWLGEHFGYRYLPRLLGDFESRPQIERFNWVLLLRAGSETVALHVDALRGNQEVVVKNAGPQYARMVGYSGATVLGDGEIVLILNPVALAARSPAGADDGAILQAAVTVPSQPTVMVVDDSLTVRKITGRLLEREGYRVITAKDGVDALEQLLTVRPDVIIADIEMPRMDGFDLTRNIRADVKLKVVPIIMITSRTAEKHKRYAEEIGVNHYLGKPYDEDVLLDLIRGFAPPSES
ncbi:MAG: Hpt domain-containing protein [Zoogloea sp.]|uniref:Hpt domain-containing protein n=1 Tax=Zoogloea sp. TaxID=49181 RepID=UPI002607B759|nr:Hpt domain-containing protein [Zoogloea sp.]MDD2988513.1 Hpt domain-containing protein [Zoogloea sp.]